MPRFETTTLGAASEQFTLVGPLAMPRLDHTATILADGRVLLTGGRDANGEIAAAEIYDPGTGAFTRVANLNLARAGHTATLLPDGRVLIAGGVFAGAAVLPLEIFDPSSGTFQVVGALNSGRLGHSATVLSDGRVLLIGGDASGTGELDASATGSSLLPNNLNEPRSSHAAVQAGAGLWLIGGGTASAEYLDYASLAYTLSANRADAILNNLSAFPNSDGNLLLVGNSSAGGVIGQFNPSSATFGASVQLSAAISTRVRLANQMVLVLDVSQPWLWAPAPPYVQAGTLVVANSDFLRRISASATELPGSKRILVAGGLDPSNQLLGSAVLYNPAYVQSDQSDYAPGSTALISGGGFLPGENMNFEILRTSPPPQTATTNEWVWPVTADTSGNFETLWFVDPLEATGATLQLTASGLNSGLSAQTTFTDGGIKVGSLTVGDQTGTLTYGTVGSVTYLITVDRGTNNGSSGRFSVGVTTPLPTGATFSFSPDPLDFAPNVDTMTGTLTITTSTATPAGSTSFAVGATSKSGKIITLTGDGTLTIGTVPLTITANNDTKTYGQTKSYGAGSTAFTSSGLQNGDMIGSVTIAASGGTAANAALGTYNLTPSAATGGTFNPANYNITYYNGTLTVSPAPLGIAANNDSKTYGQMRSYGAGSTAFTSSGLQNGDTIGSVTITASGGADANAAVGTYNLTPSAATGGTFNPANYNLIYYNGTLTVSPAPLSIAANNDSKTYGQSKSYGGDSTVFTSSGLQNGETIGSVTITASGGTAANAAVGTYDLTPSAATGGTFNAANYDITYHKGTLTVNALVVNLVGTRAYDGTTTAAAGILSVANKVGSDDVTVASGNGTLADANVGSQTIASFGTLGLGGAAAGNYTLSGASGAVSITARAITVSADANSKVYGAGDPPLTYQITSGSLVNGDTFSGSLTRLVGENVGSYAVQQGTLALSADYTLTYVGADLTITARPITVTANPQTKVYGDVDPALTYQITSGSLTFSDAFSGALTREAGESVGTYAITQGTLGLSANYALTYVGADLTITARPITVTANPQTKVYGDIDPALTYQITSGSLAFSDAFSGALAREAGESVGTYAITQGTLGLSANYALSYVGANLTITVRPITVTADAESRHYGDPDPTLTYKVTSGSLPFSDAFSGALTRDPGEAVGTYAIRQGTLALSANYALTYVGADLTVMARPITVTADPQTKVYGDPDPALTYKVTSGSLAFSDALGGALTRDPGEAVGTYAIRQGTVALNANYTLTYAGADLTIAARSITVTADVQTKVYGDADPALTYKITSGSLVNGDTFNGSLTRVAGESVGTYAIQQGTLALSADYTLTYVGANLTITGRPITVTAEVQTKVYGDADPALTYKITSGSLVNGDTFSGSLTRVAGENVGTYAIQQGTLALSADYTLTYAGANLTITARSITVTADAQTKVYGNADPALTYKITSGSLAFSDAFSGILARDAGEKVGTYAIRQGTLALNTNYSLTYVGANLTITVRPITITADTESKYYGDPDPALTYKITGSLAFSDAFSGALTRDPGEAVGTYAIRQGTLTLSANYTLTYVGANLTITVRPITITADAKSKYYGDPDPALTYKVTTGSLAFSDALSGALTRDPGEAVGTYAIRQGTVALNANYTLTYVGANLTINKRPTALVYQGQTSALYGSSVTVKATLTDITPTLSSPLPIGGQTIVFTIGSSTTSAITAADGVAQGTLTLSPQDMPDTYSVSGLFAGTEIYAPCSDPDPFTIAPAPSGPLPSQPLYTGNLFFWTTGPNSKTATLTLSATITDLASVTGDIRYAKVTFAIRNGTTCTPITGAANLPVGLVDPANLKVGAATAIVQYNLGSATAVELDVAVIVSGAYSCNDPQYDQIIVVAVPMPRGQIVGCGNTINGSDSSGYIAGGLGLETDFGFNVQYNKSLTNPQGGVDIYVHSYYRPDGTRDGLIHTYNIKSTAIAVLAIPSAGTASFGSKANLTEITNPNKPASIVGGETLQLDILGNQTPVTDDTIAITLYRKAGGIWFSSKWSVNQTVPTNISEGGTISVHTN